MGAPRVSVHQCEVDHTKGALKLGSLVDLPEHQLRVAVPLDLEDYAETVAIRLVPDVRDTVDGLVLHALDDVLDEGGLVHHVGDLRDDGRRLPPLALLHVGLPSDHNPAPARSVGVDHAVPAEDDSSRGEVRTRKACVHLAELRLLAGVDHVGKGVHHLAEVMGRDVGRHPHGDARAAVHQQVRNEGGRTLGS